MHASIAKIALNPVVAALVKIMSTVHILALCIMNMLESTRNTCLVGNTM